MQSICAITRIATPLGLVQLTATDTHLIGVRIDPIDTGTRDVPRDHPLLQEAAAQIEDWFAGRRQAFDLPVMPATTPRGQALRAGIAAIGYGETLTYGQLAAHIGSSPRAIGQACRRNPFPIIIPCHRVTSAGAQEFYSGGNGPRTKAWLIAFERGQPYTYGSNRLL
jgi:methylated-DNA-[protein]-cysteine S-methyltransferase